MYPIKDIITSYTKLTLSNHKFLQRGTWDLFLRGDAIRPCLFRCERKGMPWPWKILHKNIISKHIHVHVHIYITIQKDIKIGMYHFESWTTTDDDDHHHHFNHHYSFSGRTNLHTGISGKLTVPSQHGVFFYHEPFQTHKSWDNVTHRRPLNVECPQKSCRTCNTLQHPNPNPVLQRWQAICQGSQPFWRFLLYLRSANFRAAEENSILRNTSWWDLYRICVYIT